MEKGLTEKKRRPRNSYRAFTFVWIVQRSPLAGGKIEKTNLATLPTFLKCGVNFDFSCLKCLKMVQNEEVSTLYSKCR